MRIAEVWIEHPIAKIDQTYSYAVGAFTVEKGMRVVVPFNYQRLVGFVDHVSETEKSIEEVSASLGYPIKEIEEVLDKECLLNEELFALGKWMAKNTIAPTISCFQAMLPNKLSPKSSAKSVKMLEYDIFVAYPETFTAQQKKQKEALDYLKENKEIQRSVFRKMFGVSATHALEEKGYVQIVYREAKAELKEKAIGNPQPLTDAQKRAWDKIQGADKDVILLHGATGSGKTEIYLQLASEKIKEGKQVLILVPEIGLTPQMVKRVEERFGSDVAIYHSKLNDQQRYEQFMLVKNHEVHVVVGTRSAVFMPFDQLGLIVLDEEHDHSYKQMSLPYYHCRDIAIERGKNHHCKVLLGSATPSLESYARAAKGVYTLVTLSERVHNRPLPKCYLVDVNASLRKRDYHIVTKPLRDAIQDRLNKHEQIIILLNRRGYTPIYRCADCNTVVTCPDCDLAMSYHKDMDALVCHTCGKILPIPDHCEHCGSTRFVRSGYGTQRLEEELHSFFPSARIIRMDTDTVGKKHAHEDFFHAFENHEADILIGTQMIAKGLDYPLVTLVGVLSADALLVRNDFRSVETTFDLIVQASGRSGRGKDVGEVYIQAFDINHYGIQTASHHDYLRFFNEEMKYRHLADYPPYTYLISLVFSHKNLEKYMDQINDLASQLKQSGDFKVLGPSDLLRIYDKQRKRIIVKGKNLNRMIEEVRKVYDQFIQNCPAVQVVADVNPLSVE